MSNFRHTEEMLCMPKSSAPSTIKSDTKVKLKRKLNMTWYRNTAVNSKQTQLCPTEATRCLDHKHGYCWFVWVLEKIQVQQLPSSSPSGRSSAKLSFLLAPCFPFSLFLSFPCTNYLPISHFLWLFGCLPSQLSRPGITGSFPEVTLRINNTFLVLFS